MEITELEVTAKLEGVQVNTREICDKWILLTYDLPHSEEGNRARREFLANARRLGACQHTESVYLLPYNGATIEACLELAKAGKLFVWTSESTDPVQAKQVTKQYDQELTKMLKSLGKRVDRMIVLKNEGKYGRLNQMRKKTDEMMAAMQDAVTRRESLDLAVIFWSINARYQYL